jgi:hypothetical protein
MMAAMLTPLLLFAAAVFCGVRAVLDFRQRRYWWAFAGLASSVVILASPIQTQAIKIDLPRN